MQGWHFQAKGGPMEKNLSLPTAGIPTPPIKDNQILVRNISTTLNAIDYELLELGLITRLVFRKPLTPGLDICGTVVKVGSKVTKYKIDDLVYGSLSPATTHGGLAQYVPIAEHLVAPVPEGLKADDMVCMGVAGMTAYASLQPYIKSGDKVFINGGSGGVGVLTVQIAKILGAHVTATCSSANVELVKSLGAATVLDYTKANIITQIKDSGAVFDHIVDNAGSPVNLYRACGPFLRPEGKYIQVGTAGFNLTGIRQCLGNKIASVLAWGKWEWIFVMPPAELTATYVQLAEWLKEDELRTVIDSTFEFEEAQKAYAKLKTGRAKGKIVVHVAHD
jgi:NADPH:quinone reductase-like Zn-dependent oxidoreductase